MEKKKLNIGFLKDAPVLKSDKSYYDFYHKYISPTLHEIIQNGSGLFTIGLFGPWGSGKSTIVENLAIDYKTNYPVFIFDAWRYKGDPLRRTFLITLRKFIEDNHLWKKDQEISENELDEILNISTETREKIQKKDLNNKKHVWVLTFLNKIWKILIKNLFLFGLLFFAFSQLLLKFKLGETNKIIQSMVSLISYISESTGLAMIIGWVAKTFVEKLSEKLVKDLTEETKTQTLIKKRDYLNSPEQFETKFSDIIMRIKGDLVVVFDNIDRVQGDIAINILSSVKTFLDINLSNKVIFIIPCDSTSIEEQIKKYYGNTSNSFDATEYLRKIFSIIVTTPDFISADLDEYSMQLIKDLDNETGILKGQEQNLLRVVTYAFKTSPRAIKQFLNNFAATILVAYYSDREVWSEVSKNLAYLAKVQVIKQIFSDEYKNLKDNKIFDPENIELSKSGSAFREFMLQTSTIKTDNAKPFIFFKIANSAKKINNANLLVTALIDGNIEESKRLIAASKKKPDELIRFLVDLYQEYRYQPEWLVNIVKTFISSADSVGFKLNKQIFLDRTAEVIERDIWQEFEALDTNRIFELFISDSNIVLDYRRALVGRYVSALSNEKLIKESDHRNAIEILTNLAQLKRLDENFLSEIRSTIGQSYSLFPSVISVFDTTSVQNKFVSSESLLRSINGMNNENFREYLSALKNYSEFIKTNDLSSTFLDKIARLIQNQRGQEPQNFIQRKELILVVTDLIINFGYVLEKSNEETINLFISEIVMSYDSAGDFNERDYFLPILLYAHEFSQENNLSLINKAIASFITNALPEALQSSLSRAKDMKITDIYVNTFSEHFITRAWSRNPQEIDMAYQMMSNENKTILLENLINRTSDAGINFFQSKELPDRKILRILLERIKQFSPGARRQYYNWLSSKLRKGDTTDIKDIMLAQITEMICSDQPDIQSVGYEVLSKANYLNEEQRKTIGRRIISWLEESQRKLNPNYEYSLRAVLLVKDNLSNESLNAYVKQLFEILNRPDERQTIDMMISIIAEANLNWVKFKDYYLEFIKNLQQWMNLDNQQHVAGRLLDILKNTGKTNSKECSLCKKELRKLVSIKK